MSSPNNAKRTDDSLSGGQKKRRKGATRLSCAECRRLKLRCDRAVPCSSCIKRGCRAICPDGSLTTGQGNRFVLASTQELHEKISELANRVRELEDALRQSHGRANTEPHPLLSEELLRIKAPLQREPSTIRDEHLAPKEEETNPDVVDAFGSLSLSLSGRAKYFGQTANSWYFLQNEAADGDLEVDETLLQLQVILPTQILARAAAFPISDAPVLPTENVTIENLHWYLPSATKAAELRDIYYRHAAWMHNPIPQDSFDAEIFNQFYDPNTVPSSDDPLIPHKLSVMFVVLAIACLMDTSQPAYNLEAEKYNQLARASLFQSAFFDSPTIIAVQALFLMSYYLFLADRHGTKSGMRWVLNGIAVKVAQSIGLHRDSAKWKGVDPAETLRRRLLLWDLYTYDSWQCFTLARPPSFSLAHTDCKMPHPNNAPDNQSFHAWKHRFTSECMTVLHDQVFSSKTPAYATVLQIDRKLRAFPVPPVLQVAGFGNSEPRLGNSPETIMLTLQKHIVLALRELNLLYLHRSFFARAITDHPKDPLGSPYGTSVIAAYRSAGSLVALMRNLHSQLPEPTERIWFLWAHCFSCAIVLGSIVTRCPSMSLAPSALVQLDSACDLFLKAARGFRAETVYKIMNDLRARAHTCLSEFRHGRGSIQTRNGSLSSEPSSPDDDNDELAMLGGKSRLVKQEPSSPQLFDRSPVSRAPVVPFSLQGDERDEIDPNVVEYLTSFQPNHGTLREHSAASIAYSEMDLSPVSMYGMTSMQGLPSSTYQEPVPYPPSSAHSHNHSQPMMQSPVQGMGNGMNNFPQYFPVYDYGPAPINGYEPPITLDSNPHPGVPGGGQRRSSSGSPESNTLHSTWNEFVGYTLN